MWQSRVGWCFMLVLAGGLGPSSLVAAEKPAKVQAEYEKDGKHQEGPFDLGKKEDRDKLAQLMREGHLYAVEPVKPIDIMTIRVDLAVYTVVVFLLLFFILKKWAWGPMLEGLKKREDTIRSAVEEAKIARAETERLKAEFQVEMAKAYEQIPKMMDEARKEAQAMSEELRAKAQADIQADRQRLRREIDLALEQALQEIYKQAANLATLISAKAIQKALSADDHRQLVDQALADLRQTK